MCVSCSSNILLACTKSRSCDGGTVFSSLPLLVLLRAVLLGTCGACLRTMCCCKKSAVVNILPHVKHECRFPPPSLVPGTSRRPEDGTGRAKSCSYLHRYQNQHPNQRQEHKCIFQEKTWARFSSDLLLRLNDVNSYCSLQERQISIFQEPSNKRCVRYFLDKASK